MPPDIQPSPRICPVSPQDRLTALDLAFGRLPAAERKQQIETILSSLANNELSHDGLLGVYRAQSLVGAVFSQIQPGKTAQVWLPCLRENEDANIAVALLRAMAQWHDQRQICMAQLFLETAAPEDERILREGGFAYLTDLLYLVSLKDDFPLVPVSSPLSFEPYNSQHRDRLTQIVDFTYQGTLDCEKLNQVRKMADILEGYRATGVFSPANWLIVRHDNRDIGCLLLSDHPQHDNMELVYMGLIPAHRGRGWGMDVAHHAQWLARQSGRSRLVLAVDALNRPALQMYASVGFKAWDRRQIYYRIFSR